MFPCCTDDLCTGELTENRLPCCIDGSCRSELTENIKRRPHEVFLNDLMFLLCQECKVPWQPPCEYSYEIHRLSPLYLNIRHYVKGSYKKIYANMELFWFNYLEKYEVKVEKVEKEEVENKSKKEKDNKNVETSSFQDDINKMISDDLWKRHGKLIEECDDTILNDISFGGSKEGSIPEKQMIRDCDDELKRRRWRLSKFLIHQDIVDVLKEILETALSCIVLHELGMTDAVFSGITAMIQAFEEYFNKTKRSFDSVLQRIFRLITKLPPENWPPDMIDKLHEVFTCDLLYFLANRHKIQWCPPNCETYTINTKSPLTLDVQTHIEKLPADLANVMSLIHIYFVVTKSVREAFFLGVPKIMAIISIARVQNKKSVDYLVSLVLNTARLSMELRKHNLPGSIELIYEQLPDALRRCNEKNKGRIFYLFDAFARLENEKQKDVRRKVKPLNTRSILKTRLK